MKAIGKDGSDEQVENSIEEQRKRVMHDNKRLEIRQSWRGEAWRDGVKSMWKQTSREKCRGRKKVRNEI